ncbi:MAG: acyl carrier protein [Gemmatimonadota bacterium]|nr:acyl carrier protein [Gemmatimonadota bacterium]
MTGAEARIRELVDEHPVPGREPNFDRTFADSGISSVNAVAFIRIVEREFCIRIPPEDCLLVRTLGGLVMYIDSKIH